MVLDLFRENPDVIVQYFIRPGTRHQAVDSLIKGIRSLEIEKLKMAVNIIYQCGYLEPPIRQVLEERLKNDLDEIFNKNLYDDHLMHYIKPVYDAWADVAEANESLRKILKVKRLV